MWRIESMAQPYRIEWEIHRPLYATIEEAIDYAARLMRNYSRDKLAIRLVHIDVE